ncbi:MAG TPA: hypothetical protein VD903_17695, partial [Pseudonocardia sp.]|nr:hypothetical protein [Pseudonocardia sp.]
MTVAEVCAEEVGVLAVELSTIASRTVRRRRLHGGGAPVAAPPLRDGPLGDAAEPGDLAAGQAGTAQVKDTL